MKLVIFALVILALIALIYAAGNSAQKAAITKIRDGDSIELSDGRVIRIYGIDAPEHDQPGGKEAKDALIPLLGHEVTVEPKDMDRYGRTVAKIFYQGHDIGYMQIQAGNAWHYKQYDSTASYAAAEQEARSIPRGLWKEPASPPGIGGMMRGS